MDDDLPDKADDPLTRLLRQDLSPLSMADIDRRILALEAEVVRTRTHREQVVNHKATAEGLFKR